MITVMRAWAGRPLKRGAALTIRYGYPFDASRSNAPKEKFIMAVLIIGEVKGQTQQGYDGMMAAVGEVLKQAPGHILHMSHATEDGWRVIEVWQSKAEATQWFAKNVAPNLPPNVRPKRTFYELHSLLTSEAVRLALQEAVEG
jgi:hypothetical protein